MSSQREALLFLDIDKGKTPQLDEQRALIRKDEGLRAGWFQYQALQALALESAPQLSEKMVQTVLAQCRREHVSRQLSELAGGDDLAREILLGKVPQSRGPAAWILGFLLLGALGLGWSLVHSGWVGTLFPSMGQPATASVTPGPAGADAVPFEFPVQTPPVEAALSQPVDDASNSDADDVHGESSASRQARRLLQEHLHEAETREQDSDADSDASKGDSETQASTADTDSNSDAESDDAPRVSTAAAAPMPASTAEKVPVADLKPRTQTAAPTPALAQAPAAAIQNLSPSASTGATQPSLTLSSDSLTSASASGLTSSAASGPGGPLDVALGMPERTAIDVRLFGPDGKSARILAAGAFGPGTVHFLLNAADDQGQALAPGTYYLRVMTPWFSRVEPIQIH